MGMKYIDAKMLQKAFLAGAKELEAKKEWINELNVFPVPDGDTGTNMTMTMMSAAREVALLKEPGMEALAKAVSSGSLRGARGNSGVILSQLLRGFTREIASSEQVPSVILANAFVRGAETAYKAVMKPKEGTILTVARGMAEKAAELCEETEDILEFGRQVIECGDYVLGQTPEMLPVLKQAGVVDSGGQGLMQLLKGAFACLCGKETDLSLDGGQDTGTVSSFAGEAADYDIQYGYCTEFIINLEKPYDQKAEQELKGYLESIGDSIVAVCQDDLVKVHVHNNAPGLAIQKALTYGSLSRIKIDNMREEHEERLMQEMPKQEAARQSRVCPHKPNGFIYVAAGAGLGEIFRGIGADYVIEGGQTMNPSTEDLLNAIRQVNADVIYILPNNKNIILAAEQAKSLSEDKKVVVIPSQTVPQGITALINFAPDLSSEENEEIMTREMNRVKTGQITYAVRNTVIDGIEIKERDIMALGDGGILAVGKDVEATVLEALKAMTDDTSELISIYYGEEVKEEGARELEEKAKELFPGCEVGLHFGGQPVYYYLTSVE